VRPPTCSAASSSGDELGMLGSAETSLCSGAEVGLFRMDRGTGKPPLELRIKAMDLTELQDPHAVVLAPAPIQNWKVRAGGTKSSPS
jgi:hypothetical protein